MVVFRVAYAGRLASGFLGHPPSNAASHKTLSSLGFVVSPRRGLSPPTGPHASASCPLGSAGRQRTDRNSFPPLRSIPPSVLVFGSNSDAAWSHLTCRKEKQTCHPRAVLPSLRGCIGGAAASHVRSRCSEESPTTTSRVPIDLRLLALVSGSAVFTRRVQSSSRRAFAPRSAEKSRAEQQTAQRHGQRTAQAQDQDQGPACVVESPLSSPPVRPSLLSLRRRRRSAVRVRGFRLIHPPSCFSRLRSLF